MTVGGVVYAKQKRSYGTALFVRCPRYGDNACVVGDTKTYDPPIGEEIWWQSGKIYCGKSEIPIPKIGYSSSAPKIGAVNAN